MREEHSKVEALRKDPEVGHQQESEEIMQDKGYSLTEIADYASYNHNKGYTLGILITSLGSLTAGTMELLVSNYSLGIVPAAIGVFGLTITGLFNLKLKKDTNIKAMKEMDNRIKYAELSDKLKEDEKPSGKP